MIVVTRITFASLGATTLVLGGQLSSMIRRGSVSAFGVIAFALTAASLAVLWSRRHNRRDHAK
jgi:hypothetical protein